MECCGNHLEAEHYESCIIYPGLGWHRCNQSVFKSSVTRVGGTRVISGISPRSVISCELSTGVLKSCSSILSPPNPTPSNPGCCAESLRFHYESKRTSTKIWSKGEKCREVLRNLRYLRNFLSEEAAGVSIWSPLHGGTHSIREHLGWIIIILNQTCQPAL